MGRRALSETLDTQLDTLIAHAARSELERSIDYWATHSCFAYQPEAAKEGYRQWARDNREYLRDEMCGANERSDAAFSRRLMGGAGFVEERYLGWLVDTGVLVKATPRDYLAFLSGYLRKGGQVEARTSGSAHDYEVYKLARHATLLPLVMYARRSVQILVPGSKKLELPFGRGDANIFRMNHYVCQGSAHVFPDTYAVGTAQPSRGAAGREL